jgi:uncharacterized membrane protein YeaQ/YmgE (transglycosylase-associated protein family)
MVGAIVLGVVAGYIGRLLMPGRDKMGFIATVLLGLAGAVIGVMILLGLYRLALKKSTRWHAERSSAAYVTEEGKRPE